jgi:hypothetical protein
MQKNVEIKQPRTNPVEIFGRSIPVNPPVSAPTIINRVAITLNILYFSSKENKT